MIRQIVPELGRRFDVQQYESDKRRVLDGLSRQTAGAEKFAGAINPYPLSYSENELRTEKRLQMILSRAIKAIVRNYFTDARIREIIKLDARSCELLKFVEHILYQIGAYRPDFIYNAKGEIKICEINARFCSNAFFISHYLRHCDLRGLNSLNCSAHTFLQQHAKTNVEAFLGRIPEGDTVYIVKGREGGWDIHCLATELQKLGRNCTVIPPSQLGGVVGKRDASFILELHQDEILSSGVFENICTMAQTRNYFNDLRTIFIAHDKRMLAVFHRKDIMCDYIDEAEFQFLKNHIADTYVLCDEQVRQAASLDKDSWLIKPAQFGKGEGIVLGRKQTQREWEKLLGELNATHYILQRVVEQAQVEVLAMNGQCICSSSMNVVGTILCMDEDYLGPGIFRGSESEIVNVASGGTILIPVLDRMLDVN